MQAGGRVRVACRSLQGPRAPATPRARRSSKRCSCSRPCGPCSKACSRHRRSGRVQPVRRGPASRKLSERAGGGASRPIALSCRCAPHGTHSRVRCPWPRAGAVCARMRRGGSLCSRVTWLLGRGDNNLMQRYTDPWTPHCGCNSVSIIYRICGRSARTCGVWRPLAAGCRARAPDGPTRPAACALSTRWHVAASRKICLFGERTIPIHARTRLPRG